MENAVNFWTYQTELPQGSGYTLFSPVHLAVIFTVAVLCVLYVFIYRKKDDRIRRYMSGAAAIALPGLILSRTVYILIWNVPIIYELPLHLCSMTGILIFIHFLSGKKDTPDTDIKVSSKLSRQELSSDSKKGIRFKDILGQILYALCLPGAVCAILFPDGTIYPVFSFISIESYTFHLLIVAYIISGVVTGKIVPRLRDCFWNFIFLIIVTPLVYLFDVKFNVNYMFLRIPVKGSPLELFERWLGNPGYLIGYAILAGIVVTVMNLVSEGAGKLRAKRPLQ